LEYLYCNALTTRYERCLLRTGLLETWSVMNWSVMNLVCFEWSVMNRSVFKRNHLDYWQDRINA